jgi:HSP20 family protein
MANIVPRRQETGLAPDLWRDPFEVMRDLFRLDAWTETGRMTPAVFVPAFEVKETRNAYVFKADLPGVKEEDLDISLTGNRLTISGSRQAEEKDEGERYFAFERSYGCFSRPFTLPEGHDGDHVDASLRNGVLTVTLPKKAEVQAKKITITTGQSAAGKQPEKARA